MAICLGGGIIVSDMQGPCPDGFHVPLISELQDLCSIGETIGAWNSSASGKNNFKSLLKMPWAGYRSGASVYSQGTYGGYRSSSGISREPEYSYFTRVDNDYYYDSAMTQRRTCIPIRPFKNTPARPDSSRTVLYQGTGTAGIYHNSTLGLISLSSDGITRLTIADKNLGATTVYNSGDTLSQANCGGYFQRGNNYMFPFTGSVTTSSTQVNASVYGPGNYYNSSTFITSNPWDSSNNTNLRGGVSQGTTEKKVEPKKIYMWVEVQPITTAGIYHNEELGLISLSSDGTNWLTIADKNLGATSTDVSSENSYGNYYQRGNCYGFKKGATITTSSTKVNASSYGPSNYYSDSTFRIVQVWDTSNNSNLWGGTGTVLERKGPCDVGFHIPNRAEINGLMNIMSSLGLSLSTGASLNTYLFAPYNGYMGTSSTNVGGIGSYGYWYISEANGTDNAYSVEMKPASLNYSTYSDKKGYGLTIRPFKNEAVQPRVGEWVKLN